MSPAARGYMLEARTVKHLETWGYRAERVARSGKRNGGDLFNCVDVVAVNGEGVILIQVTTKTNASARRKKIRAAKLGWPVRLWLWEKVGRFWVFSSEDVAPAVLFDDYEKGAA